MFTFRYGDWVRVYNQSDKGDGGGSGDGDDKGGDDKSGDDKDDKGDDAAGLKSALDKVRAQDKANKQKIKDLEAKLADADTTKSEAEKLAQRLAKLEQDNTTLRDTNRTNAAREAITEAAKKAGAPDPGVIWKMVRAEVEYDDDTNEPVNVTDLVNAQKADHPDLFKIKPGKADQGGGQSNSGTSKGWMRAAINKERSRGS